MVLRRWTSGTWDTADDAPEFVERERLALEGLGSTDIPAPRVLAGTLPVTPPVFRRS